MSSTSSDAAVPGPPAESLMSTAVTVGSKSERVDSTTSTFVFRSVRYLPDVPPVICPACGSSQTASTSCASAVSMSDTDSTPATIFHWL